MLPPEAHKKHRCKRCFFGAFGTILIEGVRPSNSPGSAPGLRLCKLSIFKHFTKSYFLYPPNLVAFGHIFLSDQRTKETDKQELSVIRHSRLDREAQYQSLFFEDKWPVNPVKMIPFVPEPPAVGTVGCTVELQKSFLERCGNPVLYSRFYIFRPFKILHGPIKYSPGIIIL